LPHLSTFEINPPAAFHHQLSIKFCVPPVHNSDGFDIVVSAGLDDKTGTLQTTL
jgi:hypothetical protein